jgi:hypothetical protein
MFDCNRLKGVKEFIAVDLDFLEFYVLWTVITVLVQ